jgi:hypothetical protein
VRAETSSSTSRTRLVLQIIYILDIII